MARDRNMSRSGVGRQLDATHDGRVWDEKPRWSANGNERIRLTYLQHWLSFGVLPSPARGPFDDKQRITRPRADSVSSTSARLLITHPPWTIVTLEPPPNDQRATGQLIHTSSSWPNRIHPAACLDDRHPTPASLNDASAKRTDHRVKVAKSLIFTCIAALASRDLAEPTRFLQPTTDPRLSRRHRRQRRRVWTTAGLEDSFSPSRADSYNQHARLKSLPTTVVSGQRQTAGCEALVSYVPTTNQPRPPDPSLISTTDVSANGKPAKFSKHTEEPIRRRSRLAGARESSRIQPRRRDASCGTSSVFGTDSPARRVGRDVCVNKMVWDRNVSRTGLVSPARRENATDVSGTRTREVVSSAGAAEQGARLVD
uniref:Uncharacterized protein n=1 Tax=Mycena chlorophos TaxID=658473 RepID=A0ABQ0L0F9_MYCCL|nr:predicted protein [Mycena chlorophos]